MNYQYHSKNLDRITLHVICDVFQQFRNGLKTCEYRPVHGNYFRLFEKLRTMFYLCPNYRIAVRIYRAYSSDYIDFICKSISIVPLSVCPCEVHQIYGDKFHAFYKLDLIF